MSIPVSVVDLKVDGERPGIRPNESFVVARAAQTVTIELDAVIFDDGTLVGPDEDGKLASLFTGRVAAYQHWLRMVADGLAALWPRKSRV